MYEWAYKTMSDTKDYLRHKKITGLHLKLFVTPKKNIIQIWAWCQTDTLENCSNLCRLSVVKCPNNKALFVKVFKGKHWNLTGFVLAPHAE